ncbi:MAG TPA: glutathione S-transferase family protein [Polyangiaceae bacterium]
MKLYDFAFSPNCRKVRAVGYELGVTFEYAPVNLIQGEQRAPAFLARNPNGRVPVLEDGELILWESNAILLYLATKYAGPAPLVPSDMRDRADVDRWLAWQLAHLSPAASKVAFERIVKKFTGQGAPDPVQIEAGTVEFAKMSAILDAALGDKEYVAGRLSVADFALAAVYSTASACGLDVTPYKKLGAWLERVLARNSMRRALADAAALAA